MKNFNKISKMHKMSWSFYTPKQKFAIISVFLHANEEKQLQTLLGPLQAKYFADIMASNAKHFEEQISYKKEALAEMEKQLAMYKDYTNKLEELY